MIELDNLALRTALRDVAQIFIDKYGLMINPRLLFRGIRVELPSEHMGELNIRVDSSGWKTFQLDPMCSVQKFSAYHFQIETGCDGLISSVRYVKNNNYDIYYVWCRTGLVDNKRVENSPVAIQEAIDVIAGILAHGEFNLTPELDHN